MPSTWGWRPEELLQTQISFSFETVAVYADPIRAGEHHTATDRAPSRAMPEVLRLLRHGVSKASGPTMLILAALGKFAPATLAILTDPWQILISIGILIPLSCEFLPLVLTYPLLLASLWGARPCHQKLSTRDWGDLPDLFF
jgi:hypothetical protein